MGQIVPVLAAITVALLRQTFSAASPHENEYVREACCHHQLLAAMQGLTC